VARYRLAVLGAALLFSTGGAAIKACSLSGWQVGSFRSAVAAVVLALAIPAARRGWTWRTALVGVGYAATMILFVLGNKLTTAANTIFLQSTAPIYILALSPWLLQERISRRDLVQMAAILVGLVLFFIDIEPATKSAPNPMLGNILSMVAGMTWAATLMGLRWLERASDSKGAGLGAVVVGNIFAALFAAPLALPVGSSTTLDWLMIAYLGAIQIGLAYVLLTYAFKHVPAFEASLLILIEPTFNPVWAWVFQGEVPAKLAMAGGGVILCASIVKAWFDKRDRKAAPVEGDRSQAPDNASAKAGVTPEAQS